MKKLFDDRFLEWFAVWLLAIVVVVLRCRQVPVFPVHEDELISFDVMRSIVASGLPLTSVGEIYWRSALAYYLMAIPLLFAEPSLLLYRLAPILCSALLLPPAYALARLAGGRLAAWMTVLFLAFSAYQNHHASFSRFYMPFQLFFLLAVLGLWFYCQTPRRSTGLWLAATILLAIGSHHLAIQLAPIGLLAWWLSGRPPLWRDRLFWIALLITAGWGWLCWVWSPGNVHTGSTALPLILANLDDKLAFFRLFAELTPWGWTLILLGLYPIWRERMPAWLYLYGGFLFSLLVLSLIAPADNPRYMVHLYPLGVLLACLSLAWWVNFLRAWIKSPVRPGWSKETVAAGVILVTAAGYGLAVENREVHSGFGTHFRSMDQRPAHDFLRRMMPSGARLISTDPGLTGYYLERPADYWLREQYDQASGAYHPFTPDEKKRNPGYYLDSPQRLRELLTEFSGELWLYASWKIVWAVSPETDALIRQHFRPRFIRDESYVLVRPAVKQP